MLESQTQLTVRERLLIKKAIEEKKIPDEVWPMLADLLQANENANKKIAHYNNWNL